MSEEQLTLTEQEWILIRLARDEVSLLWQEDTKELFGRISRIYEQRAAGAGPEAAFDFLFLVPGALCQLDLFPWLSATLSLFFREGDPTSLRLVGNPNRRGGGRTGGPVPRPERDLRRSQQVDRLRMQGATRADALVAVGTAEHVSPDAIRKSIDRAQEADPQRFSEEFRRVGTQVSSSAEPDEVADAAESFPTADTPGEPDGSHGGSADP